jgi:hypothetical protein
LKLAGKANVGGRLNFSRKEWEGVQRVLQTQQQSDNENYRQCAEQLTPEFLKKLDAEDREKTPTSVISNFPITVIASGATVYFAPRISVEKILYAKAGDSAAMLEIGTPENGRITLTEGVP